MRTEAPQETAAVTVASTIADRKTDTQTSVRSQGMAVATSHAEYQRRATETLAALRSNPPDTPTEHASVPTHKPAPSAPEKARPDLIGTAVSWMRVNWFYVGAALSLALAGISAAQFAATQGVFTPALRIAAAFLLGVILIGVGDYIRRRFGDGVDSATAYLPSVFSSAGIVTLFGSVLSAHSIYDLVGPGTALGGLVAVAGTAIALGWFYGPLLAGAGIMGATAAPFLIGGDPGAPFLLHSYFMLVALVGLSINTLRKWRWMSGLSLITPYAAGVLVGLFNDHVAIVVFSAVMACLAGVFLRNSAQDAVPFSKRAMRAFTAGPALARSLKFLSGFWAATIFWLVIAASFGGIEMPLGAGLLAGIFVLGAYWSRTCDAAIDLTVAAALGLFGLALIGEPVAAKLLARNPHEDGLIFKAAMPYAILLAAAVVMSLAAMLRSAQEIGRRASGWAFAAALIAPGMVALLDTVSSPQAYFGGMGWALIAMSCAAGATFAAERAFHTDRDSRLRTSLGVMVALSMITLAMFTLLSGAALYAAVGVLILSAVALDEYYGLRPLQWFTHAGIAALTFMTAVYPWWVSTDEQTAFYIIAAYGLPTMALVAAWMLVRRGERHVLKSTLEGGALIVGVAGISAVILRTTHALGLDELSSMGLGLYATAWITSAAVSHRMVTAIRRHRGSGEGTLSHKTAIVIRMSLCMIYVVLSAGALLIDLTISNPLVGGRIYGMVGLSTLLPAYLLPGLAVLASGMFLPGLSRFWRRAWIVLGSLLAFLYVCLSMAQAWRGPRIDTGRISDGEMWSYTALLLATGAGLLIAALRSGSPFQRYLANGVLLLAIAKAYFVDAPDLDGLGKAGSFLVLGLCLAGLAWVNRRSTMKG